MSVMACDREDCRNIMCEKLILDGSCYICHACYGELLNFKLSAFIVNKTKRGVRDSIAEFMDTPPGTYLKLDDDELEEEFNRLIGNNKNEEY